MGRSLALVSGSRRHGLGKEAHNPFEAFGLRLRVERKGDRTSHVVERLDEGGDAVAGLTFDALYAIGSGTRGQSFLTEREGLLYQTPISWYAQKAFWGLSPGFHPVMLTGRLVQAECIFCHANRAKEVHGEQDRFEPGVFDGHRIGCERCHGPGELHVKERNEEMLWERPDRTIVNPKHLEPKLREAVCEQCHLEGEERLVRRGRGLYDFRPGMPLENFWSVYVRAGADGKTRQAVGHVEQMYASKCFRAPPPRGARSLGCTNCHDPHVHVGPKERVKHYRAACLKCHDGAKKQVVCSELLDRRLRKGPQDSCVDCHMPRYDSTDIVHTASTDHRIVRRAAKAREGTGQHRGPLVNFYRDRFPAEDGEQDRDLAVALLRLATTRPGAPPEALATGLRLLERAPVDVEAEELRGRALAVLGRPREALSSYERALGHSPRRRTALAGAAAAAQELQRVELALSYWKRAVEVAPGHPSFRQGYAQLLAARGDWDEARAQARAWRALDPFSVPARRLLIHCLLREGDRAAARAEAHALRQLRPPSLPQLERWLAEQGL
jgi:hypothetical protein